MYKCMITGRQSKMGAKLNKLVVETRPMTYYKYVKDEETRIWNKVIAGTGHETVRELSVSQEGIDLWATWSAEERSIFLKRSI